MAVDLDEFDRSEPVHATGQASDLAVVAKGGIDEARRADEGALHSIVIARSGATKQSSDRESGLPRYARNDARCCWRKASITVSSLPRSTCQKVQPLQDGAPCKAAPTLWIEPEWASQTIDPSAFTLADHRRFASVSLEPGATSPTSTSKPNATRGWLRCS